MASPIEREPYYKLGVEIILLIFFFIIRELPSEEFLVLGNYGEEFFLLDSLSLPEKEENLGKAKNSYEKFLLRSQIKNTLSFDSTYNLTAFSFLKENLSFRFLTEKDRGEEIFDYTSFSLSENRKNYRWLLGDFFGREPEIIFSHPNYKGFLHKSSPRILEPVKSVSENHYFRGLGIELGKEEGMGGYFFLSTKSLTAFWDSAGLVKKIYYGRHSDSLSRINKGNLKERSLGGGVRWQEKDFYLRALSLLSNYNERFIFGKNLFLSGLSFGGKIWGEEGKVAVVKSFPGGWGGEGGLENKGRHFRYRIKIFYQRGNFFNLYGTYPNILKKDDQLFGYGKISWGDSSWLFSLSYNTRINFGSDSFPSLLRMKWEKRENRLKISVSQKFYLKEKRRGSGLKIGYHFSSRIRTDFGIEDKYQKERRGFKLSGKIIFSFRDDKITLQGYKTILDEGIDFYHLESEGYQENDYINQSQKRIVLGYQRRMGVWRLNFGLGITRKEKISYDFKGEVRYEGIPN